MAPPKKKDSDKSEDEKRIEEIRRILSETDPEFRDLEKLNRVKSVGVETASREYKEFRKEEVGEEFSLYENLCNIAERLNIEPDKEMARKMQNSINFAHLKITPKGAFSLAMVIGFFLIKLFLFALHRGTAKKIEKISK